MGVTSAEISTKQTVMNVAKRLFSVHGFHATSLGDILDACGLTKGAFYHHFKTKEELAIEILEEIEAEYKRELIGPVLAVEGHRAKLIALLDGIAEVNGRPDWCNCQLMMTFSSQISQRDEALRSRLKQTQERMLKLWRSLLIDAQQAGEIPDRVPPKLGAQLIMAALNGVLQADKVGLDGVDLNGVIEGLKRVILGDPEPQRND